MTEQQAAYTLAGAIAHANDSLDWIEARRDGPLPEDGYARIETTVSVVRALGRETTVAGDIDWQDKARQWMALYERESVEHARVGIENARLRERVAALEAERDEYRAALQYAERNVRSNTAHYDDPGVAMCALCDQVGLPNPDSAIAHAPDCPFAALAGQPAGEAS